MKKELEFNEFGEVLDNDKNYELLTTSGSYEKIQSGECEVNSELRRYDIFRAGERLIQVIDASWKSGAEIRTLQ